MLPSPSTEFERSRRRGCSYNTVACAPRLTQYILSTQPVNEFEILSKTAPHLAAILSRSATRTRQALPWKLGHQPRPATAPSSTTEYRPSSMQSFLLRLSTFKLSTYSNKPSSIDAVAAAKCGWVNDGKDRLVCGICDVSWVVAGREGMSRDAGMSNG